MSSQIGQRVKLSIFGESHGEMIGCTIHDLPANEPIDMGAVAAQMARRAPGNDPTATARSESDAPKVVSGMYAGVTTGAPLTAVIVNENTRSGDYAAQLSVPRPGHADYTGMVRYDGANDIRGGGHFSGRLTAPLVFAGAVCRQILARRGVTIGAHILSIGDVRDEAFDPVGVSAAQLEDLSMQSFALLDHEKELEMRRFVEAARQQADSVGGVIELAVTGLPVGIGSPMFDGVENALARMIFGIPAVKGLEFGDGFALAAMRGSAANDSLRYDDDGNLSLMSNHNGGILGGITDGAPLILRVAIKPTPSIGQVQASIDVQNKRNTTTVIRGRHDPCIVPRAVPVLEAAVAVALLDLWESEAGHLH
ncbi:MAG: chorismate synthase [Clostridia bacterium]|nr:chorismate synthase [Clostridia bacterium]